MDSEVAEMLGFYLAIYLGPALVSWLVVRVAAGISLRPTATDALVLAAPLVVYGALEALADGQGFCVLLVVPGLGLAVGAEPLVRRLVPLPWTAAAYAALAVLVWLVVPNSRMRMF